MRNKFLWFQLYGRQNSASILLGHQRGLRQTQEKAGAWGLGKQRPGEQTGPSAYTGRAAAAGETGTTARGRGGESALSGICVSKLLSAPAPCVSGDKSAPSLQVQGAYLPHESVISCSQEEKGGQGPSCPVVFQVSSAQTEHYDQVAYFGVAHCATLRSHPVSLSRLRRGVHRFHLQPGAGWTSTMRRRCSHRAKSNYDTRGLA